MRRAKSPYAASGDISLHSFEVRRAAPEVLACDRTAPRAGWRRLLLHPVAPVLTRAYAHMAELVRFVQ